MNDTYFGKLGCGTWGLGGDVGGKYSGYGPISRKEAKDILLSAYDAGIIHFDTAPPYGNGSVEVLLGELFSDTEDVKIITKVGVDTWEDEPNFTAKYVRGSLEKSLTRLKRDYVDHYIFHSIKNQSESDLDEGVNEMLKLKGEGLIRSFGASVKSPADILPMLKRFPVFSTIEFNFSAMDTRYLDSSIQAVIGSKDDLFKIARTPLNFGFLGSELSADTIFSPSDHRSRFDRATLERWFVRRKALENLLVKHEVTDDIARVAIAFVVSFKAVDLVIPGMNKLEDIRENCIAVSETNIHSSLIQDIIQLSKDW